MYFRDFVLLAETADIPDFMSNLMLKVHEQHTRLALSVSFPLWSDGNPDEQSAMTPSAQVGRVMRVFSSTPQILDAAIEILNLAPLVAAGVLFVTHTAVAPPTERHAAFYRVRHYDKLGRAQPSYRNKLVAQIESRHHEWAALPFLSASTGKSFMLVIGRAHTTTADMPNAVTSFGLSQSSALCYLPMF